MSITSSIGEGRFGPARISAPPRALGHFAAARIAVRRTLSSVPLMAGAIFVAVALGFTAVLLPLLLRERRLAVTGERAVATVVGRRAEPRGGAEARDAEVRAYGVQYEFPLPDGRTWAAEREVGADVWSSLEVGDRLDVRYDARDPSRHRLPGAGGSNLPLAGAAFPLLFLAIGGLLVRSGLPDVVEPLRLYRRGVATRASITGAEEITHLAVNGRHPVRIHYAFADGGGAEHRGATTTMDRALLDALAPGAGVTVLYAPDDPRRSVLLAALGLGEAAGTSAEGAVEGRR